MMSSNWRSARAGLRRVAGSAAVWLLAASAWAGGGKPAGKLVHVADTRGTSGLTRWVADVYNDSYLLFALVVVLVMSGMGLLLGVASDKVMGMLGIDLGRMEHHE